MQAILEIFFTYITKLNWIDWILILASVFFIIEGYTTGLIASLFDIVTFLLSFIAGLKLYGPLGDLLGKTIHLQQNIAHAIGFIFAAIFTEMLLRFFQERLTRQIKKNTFMVPTGLSKSNHLLGIIPGLFSGLILFAFLLTSLTVLPISGQVKDSINTSVLGTVLVNRTQSFEKDLDLFFGNKANNLLTFYTLEPEVSTSVPLDFTIPTAQIDSQAEETMLTLLNQERKKQGLSPLVKDTKLQELARSHSLDMLARGYFSHNTPEGKTPFDRMNDAGVTYQYAGENLALSVNVYTAMQGLMQSPGHRANILSPNYKKIGIGVANANGYGEMFSQEFTD